MKSIGIYHWTYDNRSAVDASIASFREHNPEVPYFLACDGGADFYDICKKYNVEYLHSQYRMGYPSPHWGHDKFKVAQFLKRMYLACVSMNTTHFVISEDDVICLNKIQFDEDWEVAAYDIYGGNYFTKELLDACEEHSGVKPNRECYGAGAGAIFKTSTFVEHFWDVIEFYDKHFEKFHQNQPQLGWNDCFLHIYFYLAGKQYSVNPRLYNIFPEDPSINLSSLRNDYDMVHNYKNFYESRK
jgi:hypothetical protein